MAVKNQDWKRIYAPSPLHKELKIIAAETNQALNYVVRQFLSDAVHQYFQAKKATQLK